MRIVLDTNVLARTAFNPEGPASIVLQLSTASPHELLLSDRLLQELHRVLSYERLRPRHGFSDAEIDEYVQRLHDMAEMVEAVGPDSSVVPHDPDDDHVITLAVAGQVDVICTLDKHLLHPDVQAYCAQHNILIMSDVELLALLRQEDADD